MFVLSGGGDRMRCQLFHIFVCKLQEKYIDFYFLIVLQYACYSKSTEKYPSLVEGTGLENQEVGDGAGVRIPLSPPTYFYLYRGVEQSGSSLGS